MPDWKIDTALATPVGGDGRFRRPASRFRDWVSNDGSTPYPAEAGRYHLYVSYACPWAHRTIIGRRLAGLEDVIGLSAVDPIRDERSWAFTGGEYVDAVNGFEFLSQAYAATDPDYDGRLSVPVLWDTKTGRIVNNESADILRTLSTAFADLGSGDADLYPEAHRAEIDALNERLYEDVNNAVYRAGFSRDQADYEQVVGRLFATLAEMDQRLADRRFLFGDEPVETVRLDEIRAHYYRTHPSINPSGLVAVQPDFDLAAPHERARLGSTAGRSA